MKRRAAHRGGPGGRSHSTAHCPPAAHPLPARLQLEGCTATAVEGVNGLRILSTFGIDASRLTDWIIVLSCLFPACLLLAFALLHLRMPRARLAKATLAAT